MKKYHIIISGYGGETASGRITVDQYKFFTEGNLDINDLVSDDDDAKKNIPKPMMFIKDGAWYEMEDLFQLRKKTLELNNLNNLNIKL